MTREEMQYDDFILEFERNTDGVYVKGRVDGISEAKEPFDPPYEVSRIAGRLDEFEELLQAALLNAGAEPRRLTDKQEDLGRLLMESLFPRSVGILFERMMHKIESSSDEDKGLRIRLEFDPRDREILPFVALPWELLFRSATRDFLGRYIKTPIIRYPKSQRAQSPMQLDGRPRMLAVSSLPEGEIHLDTEEEIRRIRSAGVEVEVYRQPEINELRQKLRYGGFHILHIMAHGRFSPSRGTTDLVFVGSDGRRECVSAVEFADRLKGIRSLRLVVLNSCWGAAMPRFEGQTPYGNLAAAVVLAGIPAAVAMQFTITDQGALNFSESFYRALVHLDPVDIALTEARLAISGVEWATPGLFMRSKDGRLFNAVEGMQSAAAPVRMRSIVQDEPSDRLRLGIKSFEGWDDDDVDQMLDLTKYFDGRKIRDSRLWSREILTRLNVFLQRAQKEQTHLTLSMAAHTSIAFAAGYCLEAKSGSDLTILQRGRSGTSEWDTQEPHSPIGDLCDVEEQRLRESSSCNDIAVVVSISRNAMARAREAIEQRDLKVGRLVHFSLPRPGQDAVVNGSHALQLADEVVHYISSRTLAELNATLHLFIAAPNAFTFYLGQALPGDGKIVVYEFGFKSDHRYRPGIFLPMPEEEQDAAGLQKRDTNGSTFNASHGGVAAHEIRAHVVGGTHIHK